MILITGGAGFIGSNIAASLEKNGHDIIIVDRLRSEGKWKNIANRRIDNFIFPENLSDFLASSQARNIQAIIHMGAISATTAIDADEVMTNNFKLSVELWQWCSTNQIPFIYASSAATYGQGDQGFVDFSDSASLSTLKPLNLYGWSKHLFDRWVVHAVETNQPTPKQWVGLKFFNVFGPNEYHKGSMRSVISQLFDTLKSGGKPKLFKSYNANYSDGGQLRDFVYVQDCVAVIDWLLANQNVSGIFNVGTGQARSFFDLANATMQAMQIHNLSVEFVDMPESIRGKYQYFTQADLTNLRLAGYTKPFYTLENGIADYVQAYLNQESQYL